MAGQCERVLSCGPPSIHPSSIHPIIHRPSSINLSIHPCVTHTPSIIHPFIHPSSLLRLIQNIFVSPVYVRLDAKKLILFRNLSAPRMLFFHGAGYCLPTFPSLAPPTMISAGRSLCRGRPERRRGCFARGGRVTVINSSRSKEFFSLSFLSPGQIRIVSLPSFFPFNRSTELLSFCACF